MNPDSIERYARHLVLKEIGGPGQQALLGAKVAIVGAGGLQRQVQFVHTDVGMGKAIVMADTLDDLNPDIKSTAVNERLTARNAKALLKEHDIIVDGVDSFETRFEINKACLALNIPLVSGALGRFNGQVPPDAETCAAVGVVGALAGIVGSVMALEVIKIITGAGEPLFGRLWLYDGLKADSRTIHLPRDPSCQSCSQ